MLEAMSRAEAMLDNRMHWKRVKTDSSGKTEERVLLRPPAKIERERLLQAQNHRDTTTTTQSNCQNACDRNKECDGERKGFKKSLSFQTLKDALAKADPDMPVQEYDHRKVVVVKPKKYILKDRKFEMNALCRVFLGKGGLSIFTLFISLYMCGTLWAYTSVFSSAMAREFPLFFVGDNNKVESIFQIAASTTASPEAINYVCYAILFGCIVVPLSCLELDEQVPLQVFLTGCRFVMFFLMIGTCRMCADDIAAVSEMKAGADETYQDLVNNESYSFRWSGVAKTLPILIFANIYHHSIPGLSHPLADKSKAGSVFIATNLFTTVAYLILGLSLAAAFGEGIEQSSNLNWSFFHARTGTIDSQGNIVGAAWWTRVISMYIILFPAIDVVSAFPLNAITFGNSLFGAAYGKRIHEVENNRWIRTGFRLLASIPPIIFGILVRDLGVITDYTGTTGFMIGLSFPAMLYLASGRIARRRGFAQTTYFTNYWSTIPIARAVVWSGIFMVFYVIVVLTFGTD